MGITIVQKSDLSKPKAGSKRALVLAGGAISGGAFKVGGLIALNRYFANFDVLDFDVYMGISAGAFLAAPLAAGVAPDELYKAIHGTSSRLTPFTPLDFYHPNWSEFFQKPAIFARDMVAVGPRFALRALMTVPKVRRELRTRARLFLDDPSIARAEALLAPFVEELGKRPLLDEKGYLPSGLFDNSRIEAYVRRNLERNGLPNHFRELKLLTGKSLYIGATDLNSAQGVVFGHDEETSVSISEAVQASTALPGFFKPARVGPAGRERDYMDAAVRKTANISTAVRHGADLIICYNPFRPFVNYRYRLGTKDRQSLADLGIFAVLNQAFRTLLYSRLRLGIEKLRLDETFKGDVVLIEPAETDSRFFSVNPLAFWKRATAAQHGYESVSASLTKHHHTLKKVLNAHGIGVNIEGLDGGIDGQRMSDGSTGPDGKPLLRVVSG